LTNWLLFLVIMIALLGSLSYVDTRVTDRKKMIILIDVLVVVIFFIAFFTNIIWINDWQPFYNVLPMLEFNTIQLAFVLVAAIFCSILGFVLGCGGLQVLHLSIYLIKSSRQYISVKRALIFMVNICRVYLLLLTITGPAFALINLFGIPTANNMLIDVLRIIQISPLLWIVGGALILGLKLKRNNTLDLDFINRKQTRSLSGGQLSFLGDSFLLLYIGSMTWFLFLLAFFSRVQIPIDMFFYIPLIIGFNSCHAREVMIRDSA